VSPAATESDKSFTVTELAQRLAGRVHGPGDVRITGLNSIDEARAGDVTFIAEPKYAKKWSASRAAAAVVSEGLDVPAGGTADQRPVITVPNAEHAMIAMLEFFRSPEPTPAVGVHPSAVIDPTAVIGRQVRIGPHVSVDAQANIADGVVLHAGVRIYPGVTIGAGSVLHANTVVRHGCQIGRGVILHQNVSIGADGFGYRPDPNPRGSGLLKIPHIGNVIIEDGVEIGANTCVDRGKFGSTVVGAGTKIDNLCQVAHNCRIGRCCVIAGCVGISGSVIIGDGVQIGGAVGIADHLSVGSGARLGGMAFITRNVPAGQVCLGHPADEAQAVLRQWASVRKLPALLRRLGRHFQMEERE